MTDIQQPPRSRQRAVQISARTELTLRRLAEKHNRQAYSGYRATPEMLKAVYARGASVETSSSTGTSQYARGLQRVSDFLVCLSQRDASSPDADLYPSAPNQSRLWKAALTASAQGVDEVHQLLVEAAVYPPDSPLRVFALNRALALVSSSSPSVRTHLGDQLRALVADGNSSAARSLRAKRQLRDRKGRWIEMGRGVRFKIRSPGAPGGGQWFHGRVEGIDVPAGRVDVRLEDGRLVRVPNNKLEQPKALLNLPGRPLSPATDPDLLDPNAPTIARLDEVQTPENVAAGPAADSKDMKKALDRKSVV